VMNRMPYTCSVSTDAGSGKPQPSCANYCQVKLKR
jgi:hypothetical protein